MDEKIREEILSLIAHHTTAVNYIYRNTKFDGRVEHRNIRFEVSTKYNYSETWIKEFTNLLRRNAKKTYIIPQTYFNLVGCIYRNDFYKFFKKPKISF